LFHDSSPPYSTTPQIEWVAAKHPRTQVIFGHSGLGVQWRDAARAGSKYDNIWLQPTAAPPVAIRAAFEAVGTKRLLFGSDTGFGSVMYTKYVVAKYQAVLGETRYNEVVLENAGRILDRARSKVA
jgi:predicted TIM-barrel fold metal-dependent hydrolase